MVYGIDDSNHCDNSVAVTPNMNTTEEHTLVSYRIYLIDVLITYFVLILIYIVFIHILHLFWTKFIATHKIVYIQLIC